MPTVSSTADRKTQIDPIQAVYLGHSFGLVETGSRDRPHIGAWTARNNFEGVFLRENYFSFRQVSKKEKGTIKYSDARGENFIYSGTVCKTEFRTLPK